MIGNSQDLNMVAQGRDYQLATTKNPWSMGELLTNHHGVEVEAVESMEMAPSRVPEQDLLTPETKFRWWRRDRTFH